MENPNGGSADRRFANQMNAALLEMFRPMISSWMKQFCDGIRLRINAGQVWAFMQITINAGQGEVVDCVTATMKFGNDMFDVQSGQR